MGPGGAAPGADADDAPPAPAVAPDGMESTFASLGPASMDPLRYPQQQQPQHQHAPPLAPMPWSADDAGAYASVGSPFQGAVQPSPYAEAAAAAAGGGPGYPARRPAQLVMAAPPIPEGDEPCACTAGWVLFGVCARRHADADSTRDLPLQQSMAHLALHLRRH